jgi:mycothiol synthase
MEDASAVAALASVYGPEPVDVLWAEREWTEPGFDLAADARMTERGYISVWDGRGGKAWLDVLGEVDAELLAWGEARAREKELERALGSAWSGDEVVKQAFERAGYALIRHTWRMLIDLANVREEPVWPDGIRVRTFGPGDEQTFYDLHQETFADHWEFEQNPYDEWAHWLLQPPIHEPELWFLAEDDGEPAGFAVCHPMPEVPERGRVGLLGVRRPWRRRGLARALLLHAFAAFGERGFSEADLGVDAENLTGAHRLYESVGMHVSARRDIYEKPLG